jgi:polyisoprenoid-binding protein YceI
MATTTSATQITVLPVGHWRVDQNGSSVGFTARGMFGLVPANGLFGDFEGELTVEPGVATGELRITAASVDTGNAKRDEHLRSADFFDVAQSPVISFRRANAETAQDAGAMTIAGELLIGQNRFALSAPLSAALLSDDRLRLSTQLSVDRGAAGVGWSKLGMIQGKAHLHATIELIRGRDA